MTRRPPSTVNESCFDFITGKTVLGDEDGAAFDLSIRFIIK